MKPPTEYWRTFFDDRARNCSSDHFLNRGTAIRMPELELAAHRQFLEAVNPQPQDIVLDAGCGSGPNISVLAPLVKEVIGIDYSEQMVQRAKERVANEKLTNDKLMPGDVTQLQFPSDTFDKVVCASVLQYLENEDCARALREMIRVCKNGGRLVIHAKNATSLYGLSLKVLRSISRVLGRQMKPEYYRSRSWHEKTLKEAGGVRVGFDGHGVLTFRPLPRWAMGCLLRTETALGPPKFLKKFAVNYKMTIQVNKGR